MNYMDAETALAIRAHNFAQGTIKVRSKQSPSKLSPKERQLKKLKEKLERLESGEESEGSLEAPFKSSLQWRVARSSAKGRAIRVAPCGCETQLPIVKGICFMCRGESSGVGDQLDAIRRGKIASIVQIPKKTRRAGNLGPTIGGGC